jgi:hypothetical protein
MTVNAGGSGGFMPFSINLLTRAYRESLPKHGQTLQPSTLLIVETIFSEVIYVSAL